MENMNSVAETFIKLAKIPSPSLKEENVSQEILRLLDRENICAKKDEYGNVIVKVAATDKNKKPIALSSHMDVVGDDSPVNVVISADGKFIETDKKRTLGSDDKIGGAAAIELALEVAQSTKPHGGLELVFTKDEEQNLTGIKHFDSSVLNSKYILVLDSDKLGDFMTSGAGYTIGSLSVKTFKGGHSGIDIHEKNRLNAVKLIGELVSEIPQGVIKQDESGTVTSINIGTIIGGGVDSAISKLIEQGDTSVNFSEFIFKHSVTNVINTTAYAAYSIRSSEKQTEELLIQKIQKIVEEFNDKYNSYASASFETKEHMPPFEKSGDALMEEIAAKSAQESGITPTIGTFHAGAETHLYKYMKNASGETLVPFLVGVANIYNMHSPDEKVEIESIEKGYNFLRNIFFNFNA